MLFAPELKPLTTTPVTPAHGGAGRLTPTSSIERPSYVSQGGFTSKGKYNPSATFC